MSILLLIYCQQAIENTRMLQLYSAIDRRVVYLGYMMKVLAKVSHMYLLLLWLIIEGTKFIICNRVSNVVWISAALD